MFSSIFAGSCLPLFITVAIVGVGMIPGRVSGIRCYVCRNTSECATASRTVDTTKICLNKDKNAGHSFCFSVLKESGYVRRGCSKIPDAICIMRHQTGPGGCLKYTSDNRAKLSTDFDKCVAEVTSSGAGATAGGGDGGEDVFGGVQEGWCVCNEDYCNNHTMQSITSMAESRDLTPTEAPAPGSSNRLIIGIFTMIIPTVLMSYV